MKKRKHRMPIVISILAFAIPVILSCANATSVREVTMDEMLQACQFVFEGNVSSIESKENSQNRIHTFVTYEIQEIIKGDYPNSTITLSFLGGTVGDVTMAISDMQLPQVGERGIYFVESLDRPQVHPLYGWNQGHFIVETDDTGADRVMTNTKQSVIGVEFNMPIKQMTSDKPTSQKLSNGIAYGLSLAQEGKETKGLTLGAFKKALYDRLVQTND
jgi:hypothetical protein